MTAPVRLRGRIAALAGLAAVVVIIALVSAAGGRPLRATAADAVPAGQSPQCADRYPATRNPGNPLLLPQAPGSNPLRGAHFFVDGPAHGSAAGAIAELIGSGGSGGGTGGGRGPGGRTPRTLSQFPDDLSWVDYERQVNARVQGTPSLANKVRLLEKIADQPEAQRFSTGNQGGGPGAIYSQVQKIFCHNLTADPGAVPIMNTYFLHPLAPGCATKHQLDAIGPTFRRQITEMAEGTGNRPAVYLLEIDAIGSSACIAHNGALPTYEADLRFEINKIAALPHTVVYVEAGYSDANSPGYTAKILNAIGVRKIRGFFTNDTHLNWTINEVRWGQKVSAMTHGAHFLVNTSENGNGPKLNPHPTTQGVENLCNPPGRALGPMPTTSTGFAPVDGFVWEHPPGNSSGCGGGPSAGTFWVQKALGLAARANGKLGPGFPSKPY
jgi:endoglucanase